MSEFGWPVAFQSRSLEVFPCIWIVCGLLAKRCFHKLFGFLVFLFIAAIISIRYPTFANPIKSFSHFLACMLFIFYFSESILVSMDLWTRPLGNKGGPIKFTIPKRR